MPKGALAGRARLSQGQRPTRRRPRRRSSGSSTRRRTRIQSLEFPIATKRPTHGQKYARAKSHHVESRFRSKYLFGRMILSEKSATFRDHALMRRGASVGGLVTRKDHPMYGLADRIVRQ